MEQRNEHDEDGSDVQAGALRTLRYGPATHIMKAATSLTYWSMVCAAPSSQVTAPSERGGGMPICGMNVRYIDENHIIPLSAHNAGDCDAEALVVGDRRLQKVDGADGFFIRLDLCEGDARGVVDADMDELPADAALLLCPCGRR